MTHAAHLILFEEPLGANGQPLFESQADLARALVDGHSAFKKKTEATVKAFLNQALKPANEQYSRPISPNLRQAIWEAVSKRARPQELQTNLDRLARAFADLKDKTQFETLSDNEKEWSLLLETAKKAKHHFIMTPTPAETMTDDSANALSAILSERLVNVWRQKTHDVLYEFCVPDKNIADFTLNRLTKRLVDQGMKKSDTVNLINDVRNTPAHIDNNIDRKPVYTISYGTIAGVMPPTVVFEPTDKSERSGFVIFYHSKSEKNAGSTVSVAQMDADSLARWHKNVYQEIAMRARGFEIHPVTHSLTEDGLPLRSH